jgi:hypothetical protein
MEFELTSIALSSDEQHYSGQSNIISPSSDQPNASDDNEILGKQNDISKSRYLFF